MLDFLSRSVLCEGWFDLFVIGLTRFQNSLEVGMRKKYLT